MARPSLAPLGRPLAEMGAMVGAADVALAEGEVGIVGEVMKEVGDGSIEVVVGGGSEIFGGPMLVTGVDVGSAPEIGSSLGDALDGEGGLATDEEGGGGGGGSEVDELAGADVDSGFEDVGWGAELGGVFAERISLDVGAGSSESDGTGWFVTVGIIADVGGLVGRWGGRGKSSVGRSMIEMGYLKCRVVAFATKQNKEL
jgi:hypothetical protein